MAAQAGFPSTCPLGPRLELVTPDCTRPRAPHKARWPLEVSMTPFHVIRATAARMMLTLESMAGGSDHVVPPGMLEEFCEIASAVGWKPTGHRLVSVLGLGPVHITDLYLELHEMSAKLDSLEAAQRREGTGSPRSRF